MAKIEPLMTSEKLTNDDGTASDYLVRYLNQMAGAGATSVKFPVTSVNGKTGDVILDLNSIIGEGGVDYDKLNEKLQELIAGLSNIEQGVIQKFVDHKRDYHKYAFQGFMARQFSDDRMFSNSLNRSMLIISSATFANAGSVRTMTITTATPKHGISAGDSVTIEGIEVGGAINDLNRTWTVATVPAVNQITITVVFSPASSIPAGLNSLARIVLNDPPDDSTMFNPPIYFPSLGVGSPIAPTSAAVFWNGNSIGIGASRLRQGRIRTFGLVVVEKTMRVKRIYIPIRGASSGAAIPDASNYAQHQFGLFSCGFANTVMKWAECASDIVMRYPNRALWKSEVLNSRGIGYYTNAGGADPWPNAVGLADSLRRVVPQVEPYTWSNGDPMSFGGTGTASGLPCLSWDVDIQLSRGIYFLGLQSWKVGNTTDYKGDLITPFYANPVTTSTQIGVNLPGLFGVGVVPACSGRAREMATDSYMIASSSKYNFRLTDSTTQASSDFPEFSDSGLLSYFSSKSIKPEFLSNTFTTGGVAYTDTDMTTDTDVVMSFLSEYSHPAIGFAGTFADVEPPDVW